MCKQIRPAVFRLPRLNRRSNIHKEDVTLIPTVSNIGAPTYELPKYLAWVLCFFTGKFGTPCEQILQALPDIEISTSTNISNGRYRRGVCLTMFRMCTLLTQQNVEDYILELFKHVLTPTYFCSDGQFYEQTDVLAMVQVSPVIVNFFMTVFEKKATEEATWLLSSSVCVLDLVISWLNFE